MQVTYFPKLRTITLALTLGIGALSASAIPWEPTKTVEFVVPAGMDGGADQMARLIQGIISKYKLMKSAMVVVNKGAGSGAESFLEMKNAEGDPHKIMITLSNLFTTPIATGLPFSWKDMTPVAMLALDEFVLWVNAESPYKTTQEYLAAVRAGNGTLRMGGTGLRQEDQIITTLIEKATGSKFIYVPYTGGGVVAAQLADNRVESTVNNPIEAAAQWRNAKLHPLCVFDSMRLTQTEKIAKKSWSEIPTCKETGLDIEYLMLRGIFMAPGVTTEQTAYYVGLMQKIRTTPEWKKFMDEGAFNTTFMSGILFAKWIASEDVRHRVLMEEAGFVLGK